MLRYRYVCVCHRLEGGALRWADPLRRGGWEWKGIEDTPLLLPGTLVAAASFTWRTIYTKQRSHDLTWHHMITWFFPLFLSPLDVGSDVLQSLFSIAEFILKTMITANEIPDRWVWFVTRYSCLHGCRGWGLVPLKSLSQCFFHNTSLSSRKCCGIEVNPRSNTI